MSNKTCLQFAVQFVGDGSSTSLSINVASGPLLFPAGSSGPLSPLFKTAATAVTGVYEQSSQLTITGTTFTALTQTLHIDFSTAPTLNTVYMILGVLEF